jgi:hypothetical protein
MQFMIIERFHPGKVKDMYRRFADKGRMLPRGVTFINSWVSVSVTVCYQVMEAESTERLQLWIDKWKDLVDFEIIPVISSAEAKEIVFTEK